MNFLIHVLHWVKSIDIFGANYNLLFFTKEKHQTYLGAILTLFLIFLILYEIISYIIDLVSKNNFENYVKVSPYVNFPVLLNYSTFYMCPEIKEQFDFFEFFGIFTQNETIDINSVSKCSHYISEENSGENYNNCFCYNLTNVTVTESQSLSDSKYLSLYIMLNTADTDYYPFYIFYTQKYLSYDNYKDPIKSKEQMYYINDANFRNHILNFYFDNNVLSKKINYPFGFIKDKEHVDTFPSIKQITHNVDFLGGTLIDINFYSSGWVNEYTFIGFSVDSVLTALGGYIQMWIWIFSYIVDFVNSLTMKKVIITKLKENDVIRIKSPVNSPRNDKRRFLNNNSKTTSNNKLDCFTTKNQFMLPYSNTKQDNCKIKHKKTLSSTMTNLVNQIHKENLIDYYINEYNLFTKSLDVYEIYSIMKEVRILEYILLDKYNVNRLLMLKGKKFDMRIDTIKNKFDETSMSLNNYLT